MSSDSPASPTSELIATQRMNAELLELLRDAAQPMGLSATDYTRWLPRAGCDRARFISIAKPAIDALVG